MYELRTIHETSGLCRKANKIEAKRMESRNGLVDQCIIYFEPKIRREVG